MKYIEINYIKKNPSYTEVTVTFRFDLPASLLVGGVPMTNANAIINSYGDYSVEVINSVTVIHHEETLPISGNPTLVAFKSAVLARWTTLNTQINALVLKPYDTLVGSYYDGTNWI